MTTATTPIPSQETHAEASEPRAPVLGLASGSPPLEIEMEVRSARPPYETWPATGHLPFEMHGELFAVTRIPCALRDEEQWRATHIETGVAVPRTGAATMEEVPEKTKTLLAEVGSEKLKASLAKVKALFPANKQVSRTAGK